MSELSRLYEPLINEILSYCDTNCLLIMLQINHAFYNYVKNLKNNNSIVLRLNMRRWLSIFPNSKKLYIISNKYFTTILGRYSFINDCVNIEELTLENVTDLNYDIMLGFPNLKKLTFVNIKRSIFEDFRNKILLQNKNLDIRLKN